MRLLKKISWFHWRKSGRHSGSHASEASGKVKSVPSRVQVFSVLVVACVLLGVSYVISAALREDQRHVGPMDQKGRAIDISDVGVGPGAVLFESTTAGDHFGQIGAVTIDGAEWPRTMLPLKCMRVHFAADRGICLAEDTGLLTEYAVYIFGEDFKTLHKSTLNGLPSRTRVSPDGRYGATTVFVAGHSYADDAFSTETTLIDLKTGEKLANLEEFIVLRGGKPFRSMDFNFWGVTFSADSNHFYATLATGGETFLVDGLIDAKQFTTITGNVECPSLSPDGTRIAFKKRVGGDLGTVVWRFHVLDLMTGTEIALAELRSIDDQIEWLDNTRVLYDDGEDTWVVQSDGTGVPRRYLSRARSPTVVPGSGAATQSVKRMETADSILSLPSAEVSIEASTPRSAAVGANSAYIATITNKGPGNASNLKFEHYLPAGINYQSARTISPNIDSWGCTLHQIERRVTCDTSSLEVGETWVLEITVSIEEIGNHSNLIQIYADEPDLIVDNNKAAIIITSE